MITAAVRGYLISDSLAMAGDFLVAAMYTDNYAQKAARLRASCERFGLPHDIRRLPAEIGRASCRERV